MAPGERSRKLALRRSKPDGEAQAHDRTRPCAEAPRRWRRPQQAGSRLRVSVSNDQFAKIEAQNHRAVVALECTADVECRYGDAVEQRNAVGCAEMQESRA